MTINRNYLRLYDRLYGRSLSVMIDASDEPFEGNFEITKRVVKRARAKGVSVEAELGRLGGVEEDVQVGEGSAFLTEPILSPIKNEKLGSAGQLTEVMQALAKKYS